MSSAGSSDDELGAAVGPSLANWAPSARELDHNGRGSDSSRSSQAGDRAKKRASTSAPSPRMFTSPPCPPPSGPPPGQWNVVLDALAEMRSEIENLKRDRGSLPPGTAAASPASRSSRVNEGAGPSRGRAGCPSPASFSGFPAGSSDDDSVGEPCDPVGPLLHGTKVFRPTDELAAEVDGKVADMVNFMFDKGIREEDYRALCEDDCVLRPANCNALSAVACNPQVLEALRPEARRVDFRLREVSKDILRAASIITKSLVNLDKVAREEHNPVVAQEVNLINGAMALLGHANVRNNINRRFVMKRELNQKFSHLCTDKVPMSRFLFGDDISKSVRQIEESAKLRSTITAKRQTFPWRLPGKTRGFSSRFQPYGFKKPAFRSGQRSSQSSRYPEPKNARGRGYSKPRN